MTGCGILVYCRFFLQDGFETEIQSRNLQNPPAWTLRQFELEVEKTTSLEGNLFVHGGHIRFGPDFADVEQTTARKFIPPNRQANPA
jgi:hypothetical protein